MRTVRLGRASAVQHPERSPGGERPLGRPIPPSSPSHARCASVPFKPPPRAGLPEHVSHTKQALALGYSVLAMDPTDGRHQCWSSSNSKRGYMNDQPHVSSRGNVPLAWRGC